MRAISEKMRCTREAYNTVFRDAQGNLSEAGRVVLADLHRLARIDQGPLVVNPMTRATDELATHFGMGRREVYDRIRAMLELDDYLQPEEPNDERSDTAES